MRTRLSTQVAASNLGMEPIVFNIGQEGWALEFDEGVVMNGTTVEHVKDAAPVLGKYFDILGLRTFPSLKNKEDDYLELYIKQFTKYSGIPVVSLESATLHPLQSLTDLVTIKESFKEKRKPKIVLTWAPHVKPQAQCIAKTIGNGMWQGFTCGAHVSTIFGFLFSLNDSLIVTRSVRLCSGCNVALSRLTTGMPEYFVNCLMYSSR